MARGNQSLKILHPHNSTSSYNSISSYKIGSSLSWFYEVELYLKFIF